MVILLSTVLLLYHFVCPALRRAAEKKITGCLSRPAAEGSCADNLVSAKVSCADNLVSAADTSYWPVYDLSIYG
jgi:hypothetical protein